MSIREAALTLQRSASNIQLRLARGVAHVLAEAYSRSDRRPWRLGYSQFRARYLAHLLADRGFLGGLRDGAPLPDGHGVRLDARTVEIPWVLAHLDAEARTLLDAGSSLNFESVIRSAPLTGKSLVVTTLAPERRCYWHLGVSYVFGDLRRTIFDSERFDAVACISTIEHVGMDNTRYGDQSNSEQAEAPGDFTAALRELRRVLRSGRPLYVTFPFGRYRNHGWFQQFDAALADRLIETFGPSRMKECVFRYTASGWVRSTRAECADCDFFDVTKSRYFDSTSTLDFPPDYPAGERAVMCLELIK